MKVRDMIALLSTMPPDSEVVIPVHITFDTLGSTPATHVTSITAGFDWDSSYVHLNCDDHMVRFTDEQFVEFNMMKNDTRKIRSATWKQLQNNNLSYDDMMNADTETGVHPLFRRNKRT